MQEKVYISRDGLEKLKSNLAEMKKRQIQVAAIIGHARDLGDLRENSEYHAAKKEQAMLQAQIRDVEDKIARASILDDQAIDTGKAYLGAAVRILNKRTGAEVTYRLVSPVEADMSNGKISVRSPVGKALLGRSTGETVVAKAPAGDLELEILEITR